MRGEVLPGNTSQDGVVGSFGIGDRDGPVMDLYQASSTYKVTVELGRIALLEATQLAGEHRIECIGNHGHCHIEMDFDQDGGRESIEMEKFDGLGDTVFHTPASCIITHKQFCGRLEVIADKEGWFLVSITGDDDLPQGSFVPTQGDG